MKQSISVLGIPMWLGQTRYGTNLGPDAIRSAGCIERLQAFITDVVDEGNIACSPAGRFKQTERNVKNIKPIASTGEKTAAKLAGIIAQGRFPLILGGDHSISIGTLAGISRHYQNLGVIWYDAHTDINTPETSPSGNIHGMPLAASMGLGHPALTQVGGYQGKVKPENIVFIGVRDIDAGERDLIREKNIKVYTADAVRQHGMKAIIEEALAYLKHCDGIHLSFDLDGIDPQDAPGVGTPVDEGVSLEDSGLALEILAASNRITSAEFVELNPILDQNRQSVHAAVALMAKLLGETEKAITAQPHRAVSISTG